MLLRSTLSDSPGSCVVNGLSTHRSVVRLLCQRWSTRVCQMAGPQQPAMSTVRDRNLAGHSATKVPGGSHQGGRYAWPLAWFGEAAVMARRFPIPARRRIGPPPPVPPSQG
jgi:hypothetical protein